MGPAAVVESRYINVPPFTTADADVGFAVVVTAIAVVVFAGITAVVDAAGSARLLEVVAGGVDVVGDPHATIETPITRINSKPNNFFTISSLPHIYFKYPLNMIISNY
jgi:hypothetical protein